MSDVHARRTALRQALARGDRRVGTFIKAPMPDVLDMAKGADLDFVVIDLEHSSLQEADAIDLVRHADAIGLDALVRVPEIDAGMIGRLLENGAVGIQLSNVRSSSQVQQLVRCTRHAPHGNRSVSLANRVADHGQLPLADFLDAEREAPPVLVGQIESQATESLAFVIRHLDVAFVGPTDLAVNLELTDDPDGLRAAIAGVRTSAEAAGTAFGGWASAVERADELALGAATYLVVGSDLQLLRSALMSVSAKGVTP